MTRRVIAPLLVIVLATTATSCAAGGPGSDAGGFSGHLWEKHRARHHRRAHHHRARDHRRAHHARHKRRVIASLNVVAFAGANAHPHGVPRVDLPNRRLTPGVALPVSRARICTPGYASAARDVTDSEKALVYQRYGVTWRPGQHEVDHLVSLELGGSNVPSNLWPEPYAGRWGARTKDVLENRLHELVCSGALGLHAAQRIEARDWVAAYRRYIGAPPAAASAASSTANAATATGGYYASTYPTASTIYCADDSASRALSKTYLRHFATLAAAERALPGYHLHQPC